MKKFLRRLAKRHSKLGRRRKKKLKWHRPRGRDNKMREKRKGRPATVSIGYKSPLDASMKKTVFISNIKDLENDDKRSVLILGHVGKKKRMEIAKIAREKGIKIKNLNVNRILKSQKPENPKEAVK